MNKSETTDYVGNKIYENGVLKRILIDGGYIEASKYHYYQTDHLGNNRVVADNTGAIVQSTHYYPFGMAFAEGVGEGKQPYKYNGKELDAQHGLNTYDYSARYMDPGIGRFSSVDPLAEKYYSWSPYAYVMNNPMKYIDPTGMYSTEEWKKDNGITDDDLTTVYNSKEEKQRGTSNKIGEDIKASIGRLYEDLRDAILSPFAITNKKTTPDGGKYTEYTSRNWENSGPDYLSIDGSYSIYPAPHEGNLSLRYVKGDGFFLLNTWGAGSGLDVSASVGLSVGKYKGEGVPNAQSLSGFSYKISGGYAIVGGSFSQDINVRDNFIGKNWSIGSVTFGPSVTPGSGSAALTYTLSPLYIYKFNK